MKQYVFITPSLSNMGGAQMYIRNKILYLRNNNWRVDVVSSQGTNIIIPELLEFQSFYPKLFFSPFYYTKKTQKNLIQSVISRLAINKDTDDDVIIESHTIATSLWAEMIAQQIHSKHIVYLLNESIIVANQGTQSFLSFKYNRRELAGIKESSIRDMFAPFSKIPLERSYYLSALSNNVEADIGCPFVNQIDKTKYDFIIGLFSRLDKPFVMAAISSFLSFAESNKDKRFLLLLIGDAKESRIHKKLSNLMSEIPNVEFIVTGYLYPVPIRLLELADVFLSSAGSSRVCQRSGIPTITFDGRDSKPIGILGKTTQNSVFRDETEEALDLQLLLKQVLVEKKFKRTLPQSNFGHPDYQNHMDFLTQSDKSQKYYEVGTIHVESVKEKMIKIIGPSAYYKLHFSLQGFRNIQ